LNLYFANDDEEELKIARKITVEIQGDYSDAHLRGEHGLISGSEYFSEVVCGARGV